MEKVSLHRRFRAFTLIELMIVLMVVAITLSLSTPLMQDLLQGNRLHSESIRFLRAINLARSEAVMRNGPVSICPSAMAVTGKAQCSGTRAAFKLINYLPSGSSHSNRTLLFCPPSDARVQSLSIVINIVGRARLIGGWGKCPVV